MGRSTTILSCFLVFALMIDFLSANPIPDPVAEAEANPEPRPPIVLVPCVGPGCYGTVIRPLPLVRPCYGRRCGYY
ncbi:hypothetical protein Trydic_g6478 [Trypoxylus dichotomus]